jgi:hypothetical protein
MVELGDIVISGQGVERPIAHIIAVNDKLINIAYELESIVLLGAPLTNTDRHVFNIDVRIARYLFGNESKGAFDRAKAKLFEAMNSQEVLTIKGSTISNVANHGIEYFLIYYLLCKYKPMAMELTNNFEYIAEAFGIVDSILAPLKLTAVELKLFATVSLAYRAIRHPVVSEVLSITRSQILHSADLTQPLWRAMYITRILRNIPTSIRNHYFRPPIDWAFIQCSTKYFFSSPELKKQALRGDNINFIGMTANRQLRALDNIFDDGDDKLKVVKEITNQLQTKVFEMDYTLGDLAMVTFYEDVGVSFYDEVERALSTSDQTLVTPIFTDHEQLKCTVLQYLYALFLLTQHGIIHNDVRLQNVLLVPLDPSEQRQKRIYPLTNGKSIQMIASPLVDLTLVDFHKSLLSHHHYDFSRFAPIIEQEVRTVLKVVVEKKKLTKDNDIMFNCYAMYDVIKFCLLLRLYFDDTVQREKDTAALYVLKKNREWLDNIIVRAKEILQKMFTSVTTETIDLPFQSKETHGSMQWLIETIYASQIEATSASSDPIIRTPAFVSARRKHADTLKFQYIAQYASDTVKPTASDTVKPS